MSDTRRRSSALRKQVPPRVRLGVVLVEVSKVPARLHEITAEEIDLVAHSCERELRARAGHIAVLLWLAPRLFVWPRCYYGTMGAGDLPKSNIYMSL